MTIDELKTHIQIGKLPVVIYCEKKYNGICCMIKLIKDNIVFLDYDDTYEDADSEGGFRATFSFNSFEKMIESIERFTNMKLQELTINPYCYEKFENDEPDWLTFQWDLYNNNIPFLSGFNEFFIGSIWWNGLYKKQIKPNCSDEELMDYIEKISQNTY